MARLEIEIAGVNSDLKRVLRETKVEINNFTKGLDFKPTGVDKINRSLLKTTQLLKEINTLSNTVRNSLGGTVNVTALQQERLALAQSRTEAQNYRTEMARLASESASLRASQSSTRSSIVAASGSYREAQQRLTALGRSIREAEGGFRSTNPAIQAQIRQYRELNRSLTQFDAQLGNHQRNVGNYGSALRGLQGLASSYFGFTALLAIGKQVLDSNAKISDSLADVRRTAGLTAKEADALTESLKGIDTRTSLKGLIDIAVIGGQLGIAKKQLAGFTKAVDELAVTLGGELKGGPEGIAKSLGVLDNVFKVTASNSGDVEKAYNQIGSAILGLGQSGLATGDFLADFGERVGGVAKQAGIALPVILSYGAVLQENGVSAEVAGSAFKRLISAISVSSPKFFAVAQFADANLTLKQFNTIVNTDTKRALDLFFAGINKGGASTIAFNSILKSLKISGAGASQVVSALANNQVALNQHIQQSTKDFTEATLSSEQFAVKNDNLAGSVDKLGKAFENITNSGAIATFFKSIVDGATEALKAVGVLSKALSAFYNLSTRPKEFIKETALTSREKANKELTDNATKSAQAQIKNQVGKKEAFELLKREAAMLGTINDRYIEQKIIFDNLDSGDRTLSQVKAFQELDDTLRFQKALVKGLKSEFDKLYRSSPRADTVAPDLSLGKKGKAKKAASTPINRAGDILTQSNNRADNAEVDGVKEKLQKLDQLYEKYNSDLIENAKKSAEGRKTLSADLATLDVNRLKERSAIELAETSRVEGERTRILSEANVKNAEGITKELAALDKKNAEEIKKANGNMLLLSAITEASESRRAEIFQKYADKRVELENSIYDKINDITDKSFTSNVTGSVKARAQIQKQLDDRLADIKKHFDELRKLYASQPEMLLGIAVNQGIATRGVTSAAGLASNPTNDILKQQFKDAAVSFGTSFSGVLTNLRAQSGTVFGGIITGLATSLSTELDNVFAGQLKNTLNDLVSGVKISTTNAVGALAGLAGGIVSGVTKPTSYVGQGIGGALKGAGTGAVIGSVVPVLGTVAGAIVGGVLGAIGGIFGASKANKEEKIQKAQLAEQQKQTQLLERQNALAYASSIIGRQTVNGIVTGVEVNEFGQLTTKISGQDLQIVLNRANNSRQRGT